MTALATVAARAPRGRALIICAVGLTVALWASAFVAIRYAIAIFAGVILREGFPSRLFLDCLVSFAGAVLMPRR